MRIVRAALKLSGMTGQEREAMEKNSGGRTSDSATPLHTTLG
jgi:hypothetical protein